MSQFKERNCDGFFKGTSKDNFEFYSLYPAYQKIPNSKMNKEVFFLGHLYVVDMVFTNNLTAIKRLGRSIGDTGSLLF